MMHFKDFLIKLQTLDIKINKRQAVVNGQEQEITYYDISHENPFLSPGFNNALKELKELGITDILNLPREQIIFQLQRLSDVKGIFRRFWDKYYHINVPRGSEHNLDLVFGLQLDELFISPRLMFFDHAIANDHFINDMEDTIRHREEVLGSFEEAVSKIIGLNKEPEIAPVTIPVKKEIKPKPSFREDVISDLYSLLKNYFSESDQRRLMDLLTGKDNAGESMVFTGNGNQLADAFKQLFEANLIAGCNKAELEDWILLHFQYRDKGMQKNYTQKYLQDIISSNTKACGSPLFEVRRSEGRLYLSQLARNNKK